MNLPEGTQYLGDGAYVAITAWGDIELFTTDGITVTNRVVLDRQMFALLTRLVNRDAEAERDATASASVEESMMVGEILNAYAGDGDER